MRLRQAFPSLLGLLGATSLVTACDWREFDNLADDTWVSSTAAPGGVDSSDFAVGLAEANDEAAGETKQLAVISRSRLTLAFLAYDAAGKVTTRQSLSLDTNSGGPFEALSQTPVVASDPTSGRVAVAALGKVAIGEPGRSSLEVVMIPSSTKSAGLTFLTANATTYLAAATERGIAMIDMATPPATTMLCTAPMDITRIVALGTVRIGGADQLVIWSENSPMMRAEVAPYAVVIAGDTCTLTLTGTVNTELSVPNRTDYPLIEGARIASIPGTDAVAIADPLKQLVSVYGFGPPTTVATFAAPDVTSLAVGKLGADTYVFVGAPNQDVEGVTNAGRVQATKLTGIVPAQTPELTLHDASPDSEQRFGRAVAVVPFLDASNPIVVVGAADEMFSYFRTQLYDERRAQ